MANGCLNSPVLASKLTASCLEAGCSLGYKGKSCLLSAAENMYVVSVEVLFSGASPALVAIGLGVKTRMVAVGYTAGTTIASRFASGIGRRDDRCPITGRAERRNIPEQTQIRRKWQGSWTGRNRTFGLQEKRFSCMYGASSTPPDVSLYRAWW